MSRASRRPHRRITPTTVLWLAIACGITPAHTAAAPPAPSPGAVAIAVVSTEPGHAAAALVEAEALAAAPELGLRIVERQRIDAVLAEQAIGAAGLTEATRAVRLGELVVADVVLIAEPIIPDGLRLRAVETQTGVVLSDELMPADPEVLPAAAHDVLRHAAARHRLDPGQRLYVALAGFTSEVPAAEAERAAATLEILIATALHAQEQVVVLERQELHRLVQEKIIDGDGSRFPGAALLIEGTLHPGNADAAVPRLRLRLARVGGGTEVHDLTAPAEQGLPGLRDRVVAACLATLGDAPTPAAPGPDPAAAEADRLLARAAWLVGHRDLEHRAYPMAEAALALDPTPERRAAAANIYPTHALTEGLTPDGVLRAYHLRLRRDELRAEVMLHRIATAPRKLDVSLVADRLPWDYATQAATPELRRLWRRMAEIQWDLYRRAVELARRQNGPLWLVHLYQLETLGGVVDGAEAYNREAIRLLEQLRDEAAGLEDWDRARWERALSDMDSVLIFRRGADIDPGAPPFTYREAEPVVRWLSRCEQPHLRMAGLTLQTKWETGEARLRAAREAVDLLFISEQIVDRPHHDDLCPHAHAAQILFKTLEEAGELRPWVEGVLARARQGEVGPLVYHPHYTGQLLYAAAPGPGRRVDLPAAARLHEAVLEILDDAEPGGALREAAEATRKHVHKNLARLRRQIEPTPKNLWDLYAFDRIELDGRTPDMRYPVHYWFAPGEYAEHRDRQLLIAWFLEEEPSEYHEFFPWRHVRLTRSSLRGGPVEALGGLRIHGLIGDGCQVASFGGRVLVAGGDGLTLLEDGEAHRYGVKAGAPSDFASAVVRVDERRALVGFRDGLAWFDVEARRFEVIAAARRVGGTGPLDASGTYWIQNLIYHPGARRAYFHLAGSQAWFLDLDSGAIDPLKPPFSGGSLLRRDRSELIMTSNGHPWRLDPHTNQFAPYEPAWWPDAEYRDEWGPLRPGEGTWIGEHCLVNTHAYEVSLYGPGGVVSKRNITRAAFTHPVPEGLIVGQAGPDFDGQPASLWLMRRKEP